MKTSTLVIMAIIIIFAMIFITGIIVSAIENQKQNNEYSAPSLFAHQTCVTNEQNINGIIQKNTICN